MLILSGVLLYLLNRKVGQLIDPSTLGPHFLYIFGIICAVSTVLCLYLALSRRTWNPVVRLTLLTSPAILILIDWLIFQEPNLKYGLLVLVVASFILFKNVHDS